MTRRNVLATIIALILSVLLCSCATQSQTFETDLDQTIMYNPDTNETNSQSTVGTFTVVASGKSKTYVNQTIMYDPDTMVMYICMDRKYTGTMSVLYNADGTFKLYTPNTEYVTLSVVSVGKAGSNLIQITMYDPDTMVMYTYFERAHTGTMTVLYNADGTLKLYSPEH